MSKPGKTPAVADVGQSLGARSRLRHRWESANCKAVTSPKKTSIFEVVSRLAREHDAINLGQGFPEDGYASDVIDAASAALHAQSNQYPPMLGLPELRQAAAAHDAAHYGLTCDWQTQVMVTSGATEALASAFLGLLQPGDAAIVLSPAYDAYVPLIERAGARAIVLPLVAPHWDIPFAALAAALEQKPRLLVLNTPHNPTGRVFSASELERLAALLRPTNCLVVCDEVYEHLVFDGAAHTPLMCFDGMQDRCVRIASAGKTFSLTGWKVGYVVASAELLATLAGMHQFLVFATPPHLQKAVAYGLGKPKISFEAFTRGMQAKRDFFCAGLHKLGWQFTPCQGTYFVTVDTASVKHGMDGATFCKRLITEGRVAAIPLGAFYTPERASPFARFCFVKADAMLESALARMESITW